MSEMFTKCNGFIVSGDPLVYADSATMTGQGTVSEPFGVKSTDLFVQEPLYTGTSGNSAYIGWNNETVLYSATPKSYGGTSSGETIQLSESISNFERLRFYVNVNIKATTAVNTTYYEAREIDNFSGSAANFQYGPFPENSITANWFILRAEVTNNICNVSATYNAYTSVQQPYWGNKWFPGSLYKVVGINRKV